mmetsp:Transcript_21629/g.51324  ORF Transcript_21629/g.51324 Transcript_21629/m.51324 type:complete len:882 (+) Transcript_21629:812-3457(+)
MLCARASAGGLAASSCGGRGTSDTALTGLRAIALVSLSSSSSPLLEQPPATVDRRAQSRSENRTSVSRNAMHRLGRGLILRAGPLAGGRVGRLRRLLSVAPRPVLWAPERNGEASRMAEFGRFVSGKEGRVEPGLGGGGFESYAALHAWSVADLRSFWGHLWDFCEVQHSASYTAVVDDPRLMPGAKWFPGARLNFAQNLLRHGAPDAPAERRRSEAFLAYDELSDTPRVWTHEQLYADVAVLVRALRAVGVRPGDRVSGVLPNQPEAAIAMLASVAVGASWSSCSPDFGAGALIDRFAQVRPKLVFATSEVVYRGKTLPLSEKLSSLIEGLPEGTQLVLSPYLPHSAIPDLEKLSPIARRTAQTMGQLLARGSCFSSASISGSSSSAAFGSGSSSTSASISVSSSPSFAAGCSSSSSSTPASVPGAAASSSASPSPPSPLSSSPSTSASGAAASGSPTVASPSERIDFAQMRFDDEVFTMFSSGTTGKPKCMSQGSGVLLQHLKELILHCDLKPNERIFYYSTLSWMMWNWSTSALATGAAVVTYDGDPAHPTPERLWQLAKDAKVSIFGTSARFLAAQQSAGVQLSALPLPDLRAILTTGSPANDALFEFAAKAGTESSGKLAVQVASIAGGTDLNGCFALGCPLLPVRAGELQCLGLGMDVAIFDDDAREVSAGVRGELVCRQAVPSMPLSFLGDNEKGSKYLEAYFEHWPTEKTGGRRIWRHGDFAEVTAEGGLVIHGRSDATLNPGGVRIGTADIYNVLESHIPAVIDSVVVGQDVKLPGGTADVRVLCFVKLAKGFQLDDTLRAQICKAIKTHASPRHMPAVVEQCDDVPYTANGKKVEVAVKRIIDGQPVANLSAIANPASLLKFEELRARLQS